MNTVTIAKLLDPILKVEHLCRNFGGVKALDNVDLAISSGSITGLIGPNGSGKTTLFQCISGVDRGATGRVWLAGKSITGLRPHRIYRNGLARTFQLSRVFPQLTVLENLLVASTSKLNQTERALDLLRQVKLESYAQALGASLSYGQQKLIEFLRVLMSDPRLILLDEPAAGVNPTLRAVLWDMVKRLNARGVTFMIVEHNMQVIEELCSKVIVLAEGKVLIEGNFREIRNNKQVLDAYFGRAR
ncbi:hypothetical protein TI04_07575 [Achromatium sp. WMS2]|nr:hypothetical protein TI04_07575 [Achromatium sp. WMS2]